jgi:heme A synthase
MLFILTEALIGAGLVLFRLVAHDDSIARAVYLSVHLINTFLLLAALALTAWFSSNGKLFSFKEQARAVQALALSAILATLVLGVSGAVTALGDTLFPSASFAAGLRQDLAPTAHFLIRLRVLHPLIAFAVGSLLIALAAFSIRRSEETYGGVWAKRFGVALICFVAAQFLVGAFNVALLAPIPLQLVHLLLADLMWIALVLLIAATLTAEPRSQTIFRL